MPSAMLGQIGPSIPSANVGGLSGQLTAKYQPNPQLTAQLPSDFSGIQDKIAEDEMMGNKVKAAPKKPSAPKKKKVTPGKITYMKSEEKKPSKKKGKVTYMSTDATSQIKKVTSSDAPKY